MSRTALLLTVACLTLVAGCVPRGRYEALLTRERELRAENEELRGGLRELGVAYRTLRRQFMDAARKSSRTGAADK